MTENRSLLWLFVPFFTGIIGGTLLYLAFRRDYPDFAAKIFYFGLGMTALMFLLTAIGLGSLFEAMLIEEPAPVDGGAAAGYENP